MHSKYFHTLQEAKTFLNHYRANVFNYPDQYIIDISDKLNDAKNIIQSNVYIGLAKDVNGSIIL